MRGKLIATMLRSSLKQTKKRRPEGVSYQAFLSLRRGAVDFRYAFTHAEPARNQQDGD
ncbi:hypothetical protein CICRMM096B_02545 [Citrobacter cronae]